MISFVKRNDVVNAQGLYAVRLRICKERQRKYFSLNIFADNEYWDEENECFRILKNVRDKKQKEENGKFHTQEEEKAGEAIQELIEKIGLYAVEKNDVSVDTIKDKFDIGSDDAK